MTIGIWILSDLHNEFLKGAPAATAPAWLPTPDKADLLIIADDHNRADGGIENARVQFPAVPLVMIAGNHEFYKSSSGQLGTVQKVQAAAKADRDRNDRQTYFPEDETVRLAFRGEKIRIIGTILWTDFEITGDLVGRASFAASAMNDYLYIKSNTPPHYDRATTNDTRAWHFRSRKFIGDELRKSFDGKTVVVTHHLPCSRSIAPQYKSDPLTPCYASNCTDLLYLGANLWIHGHQHVSVDYMFGKTRVIAKPRGYPGVFWPSGARKS
jgi:hypothetical protein